jgi:hypothetical protein
MNYIKQFSDAYSHSREYFFLDLLNQYNAPVPKVLLNDPENKQLEMQHVGITMHKWLHQLGSNAEAQARAMQVLQLALGCTKTIAERGVWHLDLALRNLMVDDGFAGQRPKVCVIDFSLAVAKQLPLQKPLWIRPDSSQHHPSLQYAITEDWNKFFNVANLPRPNSLNQEFDIPIQIYSETWISDLLADRLELPWCVIAHSSGSLLLEASFISCFDKPTSFRLSELGHSMLNLSNDSEAISLIQHALIFTSSASNQSTPRPTAATPINNPQSNNDDDSSAKSSLAATLNPQSYTQVFPTIKGANQSSENAEHFDFISNDSSTPNFKVPNASSGASTIGGPKLSPSPQNHFKSITNNFWLNWFIKIGFTAIAYILADALIWSYKLKLSSFSIWGLIAVTLASSIGLMGVVFSVNRVIWAYRVLRLQTIGFLLLSLEFWVNKPGLFWYAPLLICSALIGLLSIHKRP